MAHSIMTFNKQSLGRITKDAVLDAVAESNLKSLCEQYELDPALLEPALKHLDVIVAERANLPFFLLKYRPPGKRPLVVTVWDAHDADGNARLFEAISNVRSEKVKAHLRETVCIVRVTLSPSQVRDLGRLFAYELARWAANQGEGIVRGLEGNWYRLNQFKAFIRIDVH